MTPSDVRFAVRLTPRAAGDRVDGVPEPVGRGDGGRPQMCRRLPVALGHVRGELQSAGPQRDESQLVTESVWWYDANKGARYTPVSKRQDRPDAIAWFLRNHPEVPDSKIVKLIGTTKATIDQVRNRTHWNSNNIKPVDPVSLGLCSQLELDFAVHSSKDMPTQLPAGLVLGDHGPEQLDHVGDSLRGALVQGWVTEDVVEPFAGHADVSADLRRGPAGYRQCLYATL